MSFLFSQPAPGILPANSVDFSEVETIGASTLLGNKLGVESTIQELSVSDVSTLLNLGSLQPLDSDLTAIAGLSPANDDLIQRKSGTWTNRTPAQFKTDLSLTKSDVGLSNVDNTSDANKPISTATQSALNAKQDTLTSGTNIKTVSGTSLLGSGDVGTIGIGYGGTGQTTANAALNALLPAQGSSANKFLKTDGSNTSWATAGVDTSGASNQQVLAYDSGTGLTTWQYAGLGGGAFGTDNVILGRGKPTNLTGTYNIIIGTNAGSSLTGSNNIVIGKDCGSNQSSGAIIIGSNAGVYMAGSGSVAIGNNAAAHQYLNGWDNSVAIGASAGYQAAGGCVSIGAGAGSYSDQTYAVAVGRSALGGGSWQTPNHYSVALGAYAGSNAVAATSVFLGSYAGSRASSDKEFYLDCRQSQLATNALEKTNSLMYGTFNATPASQTLTINAQVTATYGVAISTEGKGLAIKSGPNAKIGTVTFPGGTDFVQVSTSALTANSLIFITGQNGSDLFCANNKNAGAGTFDVYHPTGNVASGVVVAWMIVEATP